MFSYAVAKLFLKCQDMHYDSFSYWRNVAAVPLGQQPENKPQTLTDPRHASQQLSYFSNASPVSTFISSIRLANRPENVEFDFISSFSLLYAHQSCGLISLIYDRLLSGLSSIKIWFIKNIFYCWWIGLFSLIYSQQWYLVYITRKRL